VVLLKWFNPGCHWLMLVPPLAQGTIPKGTPVSFIARPATIGQTELIATG